MSLERVMGIILFLFLFFLVMLLITTLLEYYTGNFDFSVYFFMIGSLILTIIICVLFIIHIGGKLI